MSLFYQFVVHAHRVAAQGVRLEFWSSARRSTSGRTGPRPVGAAFPSTRWKDEAEPVLPAELSGLPGSEWRFHALGLRSGAHRKRGNQQGAAPQSCLDIASSSVTKFKSTVLADADLACRDSRFRGKMPSWADILARLLMILAV